MNNIVDTYSIMQGMEKYVVSGAVPGLKRVAFHSPDKGAYTDGDCIFLPSPEATFNEKDLLLWRYYAEHEMGHEDPVNAHPHWRDVQKAHRNKKEDKIDELFWSIANCISDHVQEHNRIGVMVGRDQVLMQGREEFMRRQFNSKEAQDSKMAALGFWDYEARAKWNPIIAAAGPLVSNMAKWPISEEWSKKFKAALDPSVLKNEQEVFEATKIIRAMFTDEEAKDYNDAQFKGGKPEIGENPAEMEEHKATAGKADKENPDGVPSGIRSEPEGGRSEGTYHSRKPVGIAKFGGRRGGYGGMEYAGAIEDLVKRTNLPAKVRAHLLAHKMAKWGSGYRSGKLDTSRLTDVLRGKDDVFRRREDKRMVNTAVSLLVDASGSMAGRAYSMACAAAVMLAEAMQGIGVSVEMAGFTEMGGSADDLVHEVIQPFGTRFVKPRAVQAFSELGRHLSSNADGENILYAYSRLKAQPQPKKILIVLSDGSPSASGYYTNSMSVEQFTKNTIKTVEADKNVELWAIGLCYNPTMYRNRVVVNHGDSLEQALLQLVSKFVCPEDS